MPPKTSQPGPWESLSIIVLLAHRRWPDLEKWLGSQAVVTHTFNPSTPEERQTDFSEFKASLVYRVSSKM